MILAGKCLLNNSGLFIKFLICLIIISFLFQAVWDTNLRSTSWLLELGKAIKNGAGLPIVGAFLLVSVNLGFEAWKWQYLSSKIEKITFGSAYRAVLVGICLGFVTPNRVGDYAGRILELRSRQRLEALGAILLGRLCQLGLTLAGGSLGILYFAFISLPPTSWALYLSIAGVLACFNMGFLLVLFYPKVVLNLLQVIPGLQHFMPYINTIAHYSGFEIRNLLGIAGLRYLIFVFQFMWLLEAFNVQAAWWQMAFGVAGTFLLKSVAPSFSAITDLGMRELSALYFFSLIKQNKIFVMSASLSLWFLNMVLPCLVGLLFVWQMRWRKSN